LSFYDPKEKKRKPDISREALARRIKTKLSKHLIEIGFIKSSSGKYIIPSIDKDSIRLIHSSQRREKLIQSKKFLNKNYSVLIEYFASGKEISPKKISPRIELVVSGTMQANLFRLASMTWSIPVSGGYGRRMRFLVWDDNNGKLIGIFALGDPVFNLRARDMAIGWNASDRKERLANVMDAYILGAVPPYNMLLSGKLVACVIRTKEVHDFFSERYGNSCGIISGKKKHPNLVMVTTSSALGKSAIYNRLRINGVQYFESLGYSSGFGHFHIPSELFNEMRQYLSLCGHDYFSNNRFGNGPNWKFRAIRATLELIKMDRNLLNHGINREVFACRLAKNADYVLSGTQKKPNYDELLSTNEVSDLAIERWVCPRALRRPEFVNWHRNNIEQLLVL